LSVDFGAYRDKVVAVRGVYYDGLRTQCPQKCADAPWPSFIELTGVDGSDWSVVSHAQKTAEDEARKGRRVEVWVTAVGQLRTIAHRSPLGPCDRIGSAYYGFGHLGVAPAELIAFEFRDVEIRPNAASIYDYGHIYRGPL